MRKERGKEEEKEEQEKDKEKKTKRGHALMQSCLSTSKIEFEFDWFFSSPLVVFPNTFFDTFSDTFSDLISVLISDWLERENEERRISSSNKISPPE